MKELQIAACFIDYKSERERLQIGAALGISNRCKENSDRGTDYKLGQEGFQIGAGVTNRGRDYKLVQSNVVHLTKKFSVL